MSQEDFNLIFCSVQELQLLLDKPFIGNNKATSINFPEFSVYIQSYLNKLQN